MTSQALQTDEDSRFGLPMTEAQTLRIRQAMIEEAGRRARRTA